MRYLLAAALAISLLSGCFHGHKVEKLDLSVGRLQADAQITVDGMADEPAWRDAAAMPFEKTGKALFVWDGDRLYGHVSKYEHQKFGFAADEQICIGVSAHPASVTLAFDQSHTSNMLQLREAWLGRGTTRMRLPPHALAAATGTQPAKRGYPWRVEFALDWRALLPDDKPMERISVRVQRLVPVRSKYILSMEPPDDLKLITTGAGASD